MPAKKNIQKQKKTEQRSMVDFGTSVSRFWKKYFDFSGFAQRSEYWFAYLFVLVIYLVIFGLMGEKGWISDFSAYVFLAFFAIVFVPRLSIAARRLHDAGFSAWWLLIIMPLSIVVMGYLAPWLFGHNGVVYGYTADMIALSFSALLFGYELPLFIIGLLPPRLKNNKYLK